MKKKQNQIKNIYPIATQNLDRMIKNLKNKELKILIAKIRKFQLIKNEILIPRICKAAKITV